MRVRIIHDTTYTYEYPARSVIQILRMTPRSFEGHHVLRWRIEPNVDGSFRAQEDALGNIKHRFSNDTPVSELTLRVVGEVETMETGGLVRGAPDPAPTAYFLRETDLTRPDEEIRAFAASFASHSGNTLGLLHDLTNTLYRDIAFDTEPTHAATTASEAFAMRKGVCQDLTHIFLTTARLLDIPARYVSGYFRRNDGVVAQEAAHAWAEAYVEDLGWVGFDPTNGICMSEAHIRVAIGLDYLEAAPIRGARFGGGSEDLKVNLHVDFSGQQ